MAQLSSYWHSFLIDMARMLPSHGKEYNCAALNLVSAVRFDAIRLVYSRRWAGAAIAAAKRVATAEQDIVSCCLWFSFDEFSNMSSKFVLLRFTGVHGPAGQPHAALVSLDDPLVAGNPLQAEGKDDPAAPRKATWRT